VILLDHIVKIFHAPQLAVLRYDPFGSVAKSFYLHQILR